MKRSRKIGLALAATAFLGAPATLLIAYLLASGKLAEPKYPESVLTGDWGEDPEAPPSRIRILSYNIQYGVGDTDDFQERREEEKILRNLDGIAALIREGRFDIVLLQEVDFDSSRTHRRDQMRYLARSAGLRYMAPAVTWAKNYVPFPYWPPTLHYGRMLSGQAVLSRFPIRANRVIPLPQPEKNPFYYNDFYLHRQIQHVTLDIGGKTLDVLNIHNEAYGNCNRQRQSAILRDYAKTLDSNAEFIVMAGDFNAVPPESIVEPFEPDPNTCGPVDDKSIAIIRETGFSEIIPEKKYLRDEAKALTYPSTEPVVRLDYLFFKPTLPYKGGGIHSEAKSLSDHLPTWAEFGW